jgi:hypothetical protein
MANNSTFQYRFDTDIIGDHESMIELQAEGSLWAAQQARESFGAYLGVSRYAAQVLEDPYDYPIKSKKKNPLLDFGSLFGAKPRQAARCRCLPPNENMPSPDVLLPDPCAVGDAAGGATKEDKTAKAIFMHPLYVTAKASAGAGEKLDFKVGDIVWVDRESKTIIGLCESSDIPKKTTAEDACSLDLKKLHDAGGAGGGGTNPMNPAGIPPFEPYTPSSKLPDYTHVENAIDAGVIEKFMKDNGYQWYEEDYQLNIVGVTNSEAGPLPNLTNLFDDFFTVTYKVNGETQFHIWPCTTRPGEWYLLGRPNSAGTRTKLNEVGTAFMPTHKTAVRHPNTYMVRQHNTYEAVGTQYKKLVSFRDNDWNSQYNEINQQVASVGLNLHRSSPKGTSTYVNNWSGGCQVFANIGHFMEFMTLAKKCESIWGTLHKSILGYTLVNSNELPSGWNA